MLSRIWPPEMLPHHQERQTALFLQQKGAERCAQYTRQQGCIGEDMPELIFEMHTLRCIPLTCLSHAWWTTEGSASKHLLYRKASWTCHSTESHLEPVGVQAAHVVARATQTVISSWGTAS